MPRNAGWVLVIPRKKWHALAAQPTPGDRALSLCGLWLDLASTTRHDAASPPVTVACRVCAAIDRLNYDPSAIFAIYKKNQRHLRLTPEEEQLQTSMNMSGLAVLMLGGAALLDRIFKSSLSTPEFRQRVGALANDMQRRSREVGRHQRQRAAERRGPRRRKS